METAILITAIAAFLTSIITMLTVLEMRRQRVVSHMPILKVIGTNRQFGIDEQFRINKSAYTSVELNVNNYGKGIALNVKVSWDIKIESIIRMIKKYDPHNIKDIFLEDDVLTIDNGYHFIERQSKQSFPVIPIDHHESENISIPTYLAIMFLMYRNESVIKRPQTGKESKIPKVDEFPTTNIKIEYNDINDREYVNNYTLSISHNSTLNLDKDGKKVKLLNISFNINEVR